MTRRYSSMTPQWWRDRFMQLARGSDQEPWRARYVKTAREWNHIAIRNRRARRV